MGVNSTHPDYDASAASWLRARDVVAGEDAVKAAGEKYLPRLDSQSADEYRDYKTRGSFFNAAARTAEGFVGLIFRRDPVVRVPSAGDALSTALTKCVEDLDLLGTALAAYARKVVEEVVVVGRCGSLVDWQGPSRTGHHEERAYTTLYRTEDILNWRTECVGGRNVLTLVVLREVIPGV